MPLTEFQSGLGRLLAKNRSEDSYLAGGAAILAAPNTKRFSQDLDYFHDSAARVATAFEADCNTLEIEGYSIDTEITQPGYIRAVVRKAGQATKLEWAQDSTWRFMPVIKSDAFGYRLHDIDLATNKVLALAGRDEPRDLLDTLYLH
jgi:predicted nucleotidyltransferase component of viral defense system